MMEKDPNCPFCKPEPTALGMSPEGIEMLKEKHRKEHTIQHCKSCTCL